MTTTNSAISRVFLALTLLLSSSVVTAKTYELLGDARVGSRFRPVEATSQIPFDKHYTELNDKQKALFRESYGQLADNEIPPYPLNGTKAIYEPILKARSVLQDEARAGMLFVIAMVDENGKVTDAKVYASPSDTMTLVATKALMKTEFSPASCNGKPCKMEFPFEFKIKPYTRR